MGATTKLSVELGAFEDGCIILMWDYESPTIKFKDCYVHHYEATFAEMLDRLAGWVELVDRGVTDKHVLYEELELPFG